MKKKFAIIAGEPLSINSELIAKAWKKIDKNIKKQIFVIGNYHLIKKQFLNLKIKMLIKKVNKLENHLNTNTLQILDVPIQFKDPFTIKEKINSKYLKDCLSLGHRLSINKKIIGFINCPIDKKKTFKNSNMGVTEFLAKKSKLNNTEVMMIYNNKLSVVPLTTHVDLKNVQKKITSGLIKKKIITLHKFYLDKFKKKPVMAVLGLNPHNAEFKKNSKEVKTIIPSLKYLKQKKYNVLGPFSADTIFMNKKKYNYDVIVGMYHDQVLAPYKAMFKFDAINITLGLKYLRVSPDHGVATDILGKNKADPSSLISCIKFISNFR